MVIVVVWGSLLVRDGRDTRACPPAGLVRVCGRTPLTYMPLVLALVEGLRQLLVAQPVHGAVCVFRQGGGKEGR